MEKIFPTLVGILSPFVTHYRSIFLCVFVLPFSVLGDFFWKLRTYYIMWSRSAPEKHKQRVEDIQQQVRGWNSENGKKKRMCTARPGWHTMSLKPSDFKSRCHQIRVDLYDILKVDEKKQTVLVEPLATMGQISEHLLPMGWTLAILPELDDLTVGGLLMGFGIESTSHKYGLFQDICSKYEVVLSNGDLVVASETENEDLFRALPWSHGTLGFVVSAELKIIPAKKYVRLKYEPIRTQEEGVKRLKEVSTDPNGPQFVEQLVFSKEESVLMTGELTDTCDWWKLNSIGYWWKPWFYTHVRTYLRSGPGEEVIPLRHYYHRHTRSLFWEMEHVVSFGNNPIFRLFFGWSLPPKISLLKLTQTEALHKLFKENFIFQDMLVPLDNLKSCLTFFDDKYSVYPIWICPHRVYNTGKYQGFLAPSKDTKVGDFEMFVDVGVYGPPKPPFNYLKDIPLMEKWVRDNRGYQALYAHTYMNSEEFREMFDHKLYDEMRKKLNAEEAFPDVFEKVADKLKAN